MDSGLFHEILRTSHYTFLFMTIQACSIVFEYERGGTDLLKYLSQPNEKKNRQSSKHLFVGIGAMYYLFKN